MHADALHHHVALTTFSHTISGYWQYLFDNHSLRPLLHIPSVIGAGLILLPLFAITALAIHRSQRRDLLTFPYLCWLTQAACFWSPVSYDYKLFFFQFTILCLWQRRSPWYVHALARSISALLAANAHPRPRPDPPADHQIRRPRRQCDSPPNCRESFH